MAGYVPLQVATNYSFLRGASHPDELFATAKALGLPAIGVTDHNSLAGIVRAHRAAGEHGVRPVVGCRLDLEDMPPVLAYPTDRTAYGRLCRLLTLGKKRAGKGGFSLTWRDMEREGAGLLLVLLPDVLEVPPVEVLARMARRSHETGLPGYVALVRRFRPGDATRLAAIEELTTKVGLRTVVTGDVLFHSAERHILQDVLGCIRHGCTIDRLGDRRETCSGRHLMAEREIRQHYAGHEAAIARSAEIAGLCRFSLDNLSYQYPDETDASGKTPQEALAALVRTHLKDRYPAGAPDSVLAQLRHELDLIASLDYAPYFLTVNTIVRHARQQGIVCQGRGSAANSAVCYVLGITAIDPVRSGLLFERFVSAERKEPPDIDVDFESERREEVIQWIYAHYGRDRAALCATVMRYRRKGALRDVGKALGVPEDVTAALSRHLTGLSADGDTLSDRARELGLNLDDPRLRLTLHLAGQLIGFPRQLGTHPGGFVLTRDRLDDLVPIEPAAMEDRQIIVWDKDDIDHLRFMKVDVLGLGMLGCMRRAFGLLETARGTRMDMASIPAEDPATYRMIARADTIGTFQIESRAQMSMLPRLKPHTFYDLVVQVAIVRPGPIQGDMVHPYLLRREGKQKPDCPSPALERILGKTLGVPLFQEQAMQVAIHCAGFSPGEADQLRRAMGTFKGEGTVTYFRDRLINGMTERGYDLAFAERTFAQLEGFGSYGFPESHAASFALIAYASSYIKCHHPDVFCAALLNSQPMGFYAPAQIVSDARRHGVPVRPICVNASRWDCTLEKAGSGRFLAVRLGLRLVKGLSNHEAAKLVACRSSAYESLDDVWRRAGLEQRALQALAEADAFQALGRDRRGALWDIKGLADSPMPLFAAADQHRNRPEPEIVEPVFTLPGMTEGQNVVEDYHAAGLTLRDHPVAFLREELDYRGITRCGELQALADRRRITIAGVVIMRQRPGTANGTMFLTIEDETGMANLILWPDRIERQRRIVLSAGMIACHGTLQKEGEVIHVVVRSLDDLTPLLATVGQSKKRISIQSRDFH
ncbi:error-prone DNA polymerase [Komagataeibacter sp. FNDCR2]|uniref:error-prone DNA polymerase n=1 Tax=Komagataeibacter sp. FNDCR2 TaxID=2878682 RepID=UPI001E406CA0|nr:error-prone DNA polymerase [Komagataeibacter sp. FNDCR2]MCE2576698.1 error-prone DNA polymerase [Komagataeibacter sp. FNDCR2]